MTFIPYGRQDIDEEDIAAVVSVLRSDWITQGPAIERFEAAVAGWCGVAHAVAVSNGTAALHLAMLALGVGEGDRVWTTPNTFVASANCARYVGAAVDFVDIDPHNYNMSVTALAAKLERAAAEGTLPTVVVPVHFAGQSCDMAAIGGLAQRYGFRVVEDACHAIGGRYHGVPVGRCQHADMAVFSFHPVKIVTTGEGGMVVTNDAALAKRLRLLRTHGVSRDADQLREPSHGGWYYEQSVLGYNYRITDLQAALGSSQMRRLELFVARRAEAAAVYDAALEGLPVGLPGRDPGTESAWHLYVIRIPEAGGINRAQVFAALRAAEIGVNVHYIPVHTQPYYRALGFAWGDFPQAEQYYREAISLPLFPGVLGASQERVIQTLRTILT